MPTKTLKTILKITLLSLSLTLLLNACAQKKIDRQSPCACYDILILQEQKG